MVKPDGQCLEQDLCVGVALYMVYGLVQFPDDGKVPPTAQFSPSVDTAVLFEPFCTATNLSLPKATLVQVDDAGIVLGVDENSGAGFDVI